MNFKIKDSRWSVVIIILLIYPIFILLVGPFAAIDGYTTWVPESVSRMVYDLSRPAGEIELVGYYWSLWYSGP
jgi:hypothetical protein